MQDSGSYGTEFNVTYQIYNSDGHSFEEELPLKMGENHLSVSNEIVNLNKIYTRSNSICYKINTTRKADFRKTEIKVKASSSKILDVADFFITSEENSYGVTNNKFEDGKAFKAQLKGGKWMEIYLSVGKNINWVCSEESFFEYIVSKLSEKNFENCTHACLRTSLPNANYPICPNYEGWYENVLKGNLKETEDDCNWGIVRNLIKNTFTKDERLKTCVTIDYSGKIMTETNDERSNELGIQYKFAYPLRAKVYQEYPITDAIDLVGSVGGTLGLFVDFSFSNFITLIIGYIAAFLASRNKLSQDIWSSIGWILYISLMATSIWFAWGVLDKFFKQDTGIQQYEGKIETHPTIAICMGKWKYKYQTDFKIKYTVKVGQNFVGNFLAIGENYLKITKEKVNLAIIYTRYNGLCYVVNSTRKVDERWTGIVINYAPTVDRVPDSLPIIFTSDMNMYGVTQRDWRDGEFFSFITSPGFETSLDLAVEKNINLKCSKDSFYEYVTSRLSKENLEECNDTCLMTSLPNDPYRICSNFEEWYNDTKDKESNCNWIIIRDLIENITINEEHLKTCVTTQYLGQITADIYNGNVYASIITYKFTLPLKAKTYEEYLITDGITLIGSVGGTLGLFIGFTINNVVFFIVDFFKSTMETDF